MWGCYPATGWFHSVMETAFTEQLAWAEHGRLSGYVGRTLHFSRMYPGRTEWIGPDTTTPVQWGN